MRWENFRRSSNVERRSGGAKVLGGGAGGLFAMALIVWAMGGDPTRLLIEGAARTIETSVSKPSQLTQEQQNEQADFASAVLGNMEDTWSALRHMNDIGYVPPGLVLYTGATNTACGTGQSAMGPFYCPLDEKIYLDLDFFYDMETKLGAGGDFARAYVIAHEVGHHIQKMDGQLPANRDNKTSVKTELMADCYAGVWAYHVEQFGALEDGDIEEAINAAAAVGDDRLQEQSQGYVVPDSFTHGSSAQRMAAFKRGFENGLPGVCGKI